MNSCFRDGVRLFFRTLLINIMCFLVVMSIVSFGIAAFSKEIGYDAYGAKNKDEKPQLLYTYYEKDGKDTKFEEYKEQGYTITKRTHRDMNKTAETAMLIAGQIFALGILISFVYPKIWDKGNKDLNLVKFNHEKKDILKGLKIGAIATIPNAAIYLFLAVTKSGISRNFRVGYYKLFNASFYSVYEFIMGDTTKMGELSTAQVLLCALPIIAVPLVAGLAYYFGYNDKTFFDKLIYKKKTVKK